MTFQRPHTTPVAFAAAALIATLAACGGGSDTPAAPAPTTQTVSIEFVGTVGDTPIDCSSSLAGLGTGGSNARLTDLRLFVANLKLINAAGQEVAVTLDANDFQLTEGSNSVALVDLENGSGYCVGDSQMHATITGTVPVGTYSGVEMTLGVPEALNHSETFAAKAPLDNKDMAWSWQAGRKFAKIEVNPEKAGATGTFTGGIAKYNADGTLAGSFNSTFNFHLGNTGCVAGTNPGEYSCSSDSTRTFHIHDFNPATQRITVDLKELFTLSALVEEHGGAPGCMSGPTDPECVAMWSVIGSSFDGSGNSVVDEDSEFLHGHTVFRALAK